MKKQKKYYGVIVPMVTPFTEQGKLDEAATIKILDLIVSNGAFPFILGTTGEAASIPFQTRVQLSKLVLKQVEQRTTIYAGISDNCLENSVTLAQELYKLGIRVFVAHLPSYYPLTPDMMLRYYETLAERCPGELMIYNIKSTTHMSLPLEVIERLSQHPKIVGLKDSERDVERLNSLAVKFSGRQDFCLLCGWTAQSTKMLLMGFDGIVPSTGNLIPKKFVDLYKAVQRGDITIANKLQAEIAPIVDLHQKDMLGSESIAALKVMMSELGLCLPWVLPPLIRLKPEKEQQIKNQMRTILSGKPLQKS
ncbi:MAG: dihydrodipicolinate synthase family protein [candidate division KSB1 bacterium]|nr:dihydrodipicolinate synthase family protein [candidate division KSB1 bacterium]MDZ7335857.1 dihydrodipicolinate synthase family protein [candidate division KSB1 bacterium]MDZ7377156.1 dihydrodipicolinate synthase family protein [candidate division KSB1 bacterium]MDZ7400153.1 dihydrodipicolinate synthase family protein [candidate division KSB1 bacterium]